MIQVSGLSKIYRVRARQSSSVWHSLRAVFSREYREVTALAGIDWAIREGEIHGLIGRNGSGKSTLLKILCGILHPSFGSATVNGIVPWTDRRRHVRDIGVVFGQKSQLTWELPAVDSFYLHRSLYRVEPAKFERTLRFLSEAFDAVVDRPVRSLSLGERMKCEIICSLLHQPKLLFLDEPTIGLDLLAKDQVRRAIRTINAELGTTIILTSHDLSDVSSVCDEISLLDRGRFLYRGPIESLLGAVSSRKLLRLTLREPVLRCRWEGFALVPTGEFTAEVELCADGTSLQPLLQRLLAQLPVSDVSIESLQLEQVIGAIYRGELDASHWRKAQPAA